ncbi:MAG TPA: C1 family peptidase [Thermoleophilaceae bacterium]|nr:C1 family peptidase [Thermoleophilaceae bacterium]
MVDLRAQLMPIKNQGRRETCLVFAATAAREYRAADGFDLSEEYLHWACKRADGLPMIEATTLVGLVAALSRVGQCREELWPYDETADQWAPVYRPTLIACRDAWGRRFQGTVAQLTQDALRQALDHDRASVLGLELFETWHDAGTDGRIELPMPAMPALGGHAVTIVGYGDVAGSLHFIVRNSWGNGWGDAGYGYLPAEYVDRYAIAGVVMS